MSYPDGTGSGCPVVQTVPTVCFDDIYLRAPLEGAFGPPDWSFRQCIEYVEEAKPDGVLSALDFGCGDGRHARYLADRGRWIITGLDASNVGLARASAHAGPAFHPIRYEFTSDNLRQFQEQSPDISRSPDLVMSVTFLDHLEDDLRAGMEKLLRSLVPPGSFLYLGLFSDWDPASPGFKRSRFADPGAIGSETIDTVQHFYDFDSLLYDLSSEFQVVYAQQSFEQAFEPPLHYHGYINFLGYRLP